MVTATAVWSLKVRRASWAKAGRAKRPRPDDVTPRAASIKPELRSARRRESIMECHLSAVSPGIAERRPPGCQSSAENSAEIGRPRRAQLRPAELAALGGGRRG